MPDLKLTLACWDYDRTRALFDGRVKPSGIELDLWSTRNVGEIMERMLRGRQFDVSELGITYYLRSLELMDAPFIAIPVFPNRFFRHSAIFVNAERAFAPPVTSLDGGWENCFATDTTPAFGPRACSATNSRSLPAA